MTSLFSRCGACMPGVPAFRVCTAYRERPEIRPFRVLYLFCATRHFGAGISVFVSLPLTHTKRRSQFTKGLLVQVIFRLQKKKIDVVNIYETGHS